MTIYDSNNQAVLTVEVSDESYAYNEIMGDKRLHLEFELPSFVEIPVGSYVTFHYETYYLLKPESLKLVHRRNWEYVVEFEGLQEVLTTLIYQNPEDYRVEFPVTGNAQNHLDILVRCINSKSNGWTATADSSLTLDKCINYSFNNCKEALQAIADAFETEWEVDGKTIYVRKVEYNKLSPLGTEGGKNGMSYGMGNGFRTGIERKNYNGEIPLTTIYIKGDDRNIGQYVGANNQTQTYDGKTLHLPKGTVQNPITGGYNGTKFSWEQGYTTQNVNVLNFAVSADGYSVYDTQATGRNEGILDCTDIYPKYEGTVTKVDTVDASKNLYDFYDSAANCPNFANLATSETMTVIFQSGMLAGREFDVNCKGSTTYGIHYEIVPVEQDTQPMPGGTFVPSAGTGNNDGDRYIIFHCKLPYQYINDATNHAGAEWDMLKTAVKYLYEARNPRYSITGELDGNWSSSRWSLVGQKIKCGGYISFTDPSFQTDPFLIRIQSVKHFVNKQFKPVITLANTPTKGSVASQIRSIERDNFGNELQINDSRQFTKRTFASAKATMDALAEYFADYSDFIKPVGIQTMQMIAGDERLQLQFSDYSNFSSFKQAPVVWSSGLVCGTGYVRNVNIGDDREIITTISGSHGYHAWVINSNTLTTDALTHTALVDNKQYYLYLRAPKTGNGYAQWELYPVGEDDSVLEFYDGTNYNFLVGILNMMEDETRQFVPIYGFTEITPGGITTSRLQDTNNVTWIDLTTGATSLGNGGFVFTPDPLNPGQGSVSIKGQLQVGSSGLGNFAEYNTLENNINSKVSTSTYESGLSSLQSTLETQIDGKIDTYYDTNNPASAWTSAEERAKHVGDLWFKQGNNNVVCRYQYLPSSSSYDWVSVQDSDIPKALATANSKKRVFYSTTANPTPDGPYDANDLWIRNGILYVCISGRTTRGYSAEDWQQGLYFDVDDRLQVQREWERIHGAANTNGNATSSGSYMLTKTYLHGLQEPAKLVYKVSNSDKILTYNNNALVYNISGSSALDTAYGNLKGYLNDHDLYDEDTTWDSGSDELTALFLAYYKEEKTFELSNISDFEYLKKAMPDGASTDIGRGVVLSSLIAVRDASGSVKAGMDGSGAFGKLMLWAGSTNASSIGSAVWRVNNDGSQISGSDTGARIHSIPSESRMIFYDSSGKVSTILDGETYDIDNLFPTSGTAAQNISLSDLSDDLTIYSDGYQYEELYAEQTVSGSDYSFTTQKPGTLSLPDFTITASIAARNNGTLTTPVTQAYLMIDNTIVASVAGTASASERFSGRTIYLPAGGHTVSLTGDFEVADSTDGVQFAVAVHYWSSTAGLEVEQKQSYICANGFILGASNNNYFVADVVNGTNTKMLRFRARSGSAGIQVYNGNVEWWDGSNWKRIYMANDRTLKVES